MIGSGGWFIAGIFLIGRAYNSDPAPDTLFSPWHFLLYSGFIASAVSFYASLVAIRIRRRSLPPVLQQGFKLYSAGLLIILLGGLSGLVWQQYFDIDRSVRALPSPIHLALALGSTLILIGPVFTSWQRRGGNRTMNPVSLLPAVVSLTYALSAITFFTQFAHPLVEPLATTKVISIRVNDEIYVMNADGASQTRLTNNPESADWSPDWSPDGSQTVFVSKRDGVSEIYVMNFDGAMPMRLTSNKFRDWDAAWSPDGSQIAFASDREGYFDVYVMSADGSDQTNLTRSPGADDMQPSWSPDGRQMAFASEREGDFDVYVINADGSDQTNLTRSPGADDMQPSWSPDGSQIAFASRGRPPLSNESLGIASIVLQSGLLMGFVLWAMRRWALPVGGISIIFILNAALMSTQENTYQLIPVAVLAGVTADILLKLISPSQARMLAMRVFSFGVPAIYYVFYFLALAVTEEVGWPVELWSGAVLLAGFTGLLLSYLLIPPGNHLINRDGLPFSQ